MKSKQYRQGDVFILPVKKIPAGLKKKKDCVVAIGEATGHMHKIFDGDVYIDESGKLYIEARAGTEIRHVKGAAIADHNPIEIEEGLYEITIQREYEPGSYRQVSD